MSRWEVAVWISLRTDCFDFFFLFFFSEMFPILLLKCCFFSPVSTPQLGHLSYCPGGFIFLVLSCPNWILLLCCPSNVSCVMFSLCFFSSLIVWFQWGNFTCFIVPVCNILSVGNVSCFITQLRIFSSFHCSSGEYSLSLLQRGVFFLFHCIVPL